MPLTPCGPLGFMAQLVQIRCVPMQFETLITNLKLEAIELLPESDIVAQI